ncbi:MAG: penicillin-binding protein 1A [Candidatus Xenolissoclinum pacificiensis L6]|uniref:peptidoglycan glycosyltransferase n=1 Tax=Candidatus Xenolissoclinum pacificiensis L6 TaxID=1401685 RepID=W2V1E1_9RICK|nr:MAG: penicillin-binding protein 1A [Candidatus Xenolissoclinum pacificiensis L6]
MLVLDIMIHHYALTLPNPGVISTHDLPIVSRIYSFDHKLLTQYSLENRVFIPIENIPKHLIDAFVVAEDKTFYQNTGIDYFGIIRALFSNLINGKLLVGGSTITQQVVKNCLLSPEKSVKRKFQEILLSLQINKLFTKDQIMEIYLNKIYFGQRAYGIGTASLQYFNKSVNELSIAESALLASLPQAPSKLNPFKNLQNIYDRKNWVLERLAEENYITYKEFLEYKKQKININNAYQNKLQKNDFFIEEIRKNIIKEYGEQELYGGGLFIHTTLDKYVHDVATRALRKNIEEYVVEHFWTGRLDNIPITQNWCAKLLDVKQEILTKQMSPEDWSVSVILSHTPNYKEIVIGNDDCQQKYLQYHKQAKTLSAGDVIFTKSIDHSLHILRQSSSLNGGVVIINPENGNILSMVGGYSFERNQYNVITQANRQPGSLLKPFIYLEALNQGFMPTSILMDEPVTIFQGNNFPLWFPRNYENDFYGATTLKRGLELSKNLITVQIARAISLDPIINIFNKFGIYNQDIAKIYSIILGSEVVDLLSLTKAYAILANGGVKPNISMIEKIQDKNGKTLFSHRNPEQCQNCNFENGQSYTFPNVFEYNQIINPDDTTYQINSILQDSVKHGTAKNLKNINIPFAAKTGTSNDSKDAWIIGFAPKIVIGVYVGFDTPTTLGKHASGARVALPIMRDIVEELEHTIAKVPFRVPENIIFKKHNNVYYPLKPQNISTCIHDKKLYEQILKYEKLRSMQSLNSRIENMVHRYDIANDVSITMTDMLSHTISKKQHTQIPEDGEPVVDKYMQMFLSQEMNLIHSRKLLNNHHTI